MPCGYIPPNPVELLGSASMRNLLGELRERYDWVVLNTPPELLTAEAALLCRLADGFIMVVSAERTKRPALRRVLDQVRGIGGMVIGAVLNRAELDRNSYYCGQYYGEYYLNYAPPPRS